MVSLYPILADTSSYAFPLKLPSFESRAIKLYHFDPFIVVNHPQSLQAPGSLPFLFQEVQLLAHFTPPNTTPDLILGDLITHMDDFFNILDKLVL